VIDLKAIHSFIASVGFLGSLGMTVYRLREIYPLFRLKQPLKKSHNSEGGTLSGRLVALPAHSPQYLSRRCGVTVSFPPQSQSVSPDSDTTGYAELLGKGQTKAATFGVSQGPCISPLPQPFVPPTCVPACQRMRTWESACSRG
jgi:hypothetical protein